MGQFKSITVSTFTIDVKYKRRKPGERFPLSEWKVDTASKEESKEVNREEGPE